MQGEEMQGEPIKSVQVAFWREQLAQAEAEYDLAQYIDSTPRMLREREYFWQRILTLKALLADAEANA